MKNPTIVNNFLVYLAAKVAGCKKSHLLLVPLFILISTNSVFAGTLTGTVKGTDGQPLIGVPINVGVQSGDPCGRYSGMNGAGINTADGTYIITDIPAGTYFLNTWNNNTGYYTDEWWDGSLSSPDCHNAQTITVPAEGTLSGIDFQLEIGGAISGTLFHSDGVTPITGEINIGANLWIGADPCNTQHIKGAGVNSADGTYILSGLAPGNYFLRNFSNNGSNYLNEYWASPESTTNCTLSQPITVVAGQTATDKNFQLDPGAKISGQITGNYGDNVCLSAHTVINGDTCNLSQVAGGSGLDDNGNFFFVVPAGTYLMYFRPDCGSNPDNLLPEYWTADNAGTTDCKQASTFTLAVDDAVTTNITLDQQGAIISGKVTDSGQTPLEGLVVQASDPGCEWNTTYQATTDANGDYSIVVPGGVQFKVGTCRNCGGSSSGLWVDEFWNGQDGSQNCNDAGTIFSDVLTPKTANFELATGAKISGRIAGTYGDNVCIDAFTPINGNTCDRGNWAGGSRPDNNGDYSFVLPAGTYFMHFNPDCGNNPGILQAESWTADNAGTTDCNQAATFTLAPGEETEKNITLDQQGARISGHISGDYGDNVCVEAYAPIAGNTCDRSYWAGGNGPDSNGDYSFIVPAGTYFMHFRPDCGSNPNALLNESWTADNAGTTDCNQAATFTLTVGTATTKDITLDQQGGNITGTVSDANGVINGELENTGVSVFSGDACGNYQHILGQRLGTDGTYNIALPISGEYLLMTNSNSPYYIMKWFAGFDAQGDPLSSQNCQDAVKLSFVQGQTIIENVDFTIDTGGGAISGTLYHSDGVTPIIGQNDIGANVWVGTDPCNAQHIQGAGVNPDNGRYILGGLAPGNYFLRSFSNDGANYISEYWASPASTTNCAQSQQITVVAGQTTTDKNFQLEEGGQVAGFVYEQDGATLLTGESSDVRVDAFSGTPCNYNYVGGGNVSMTDGSYLTSGLPPGTVYIRVNHTTVHPESWWTESGITEDCAEASPITITAAATTSGKNFSLPKDSDGDGLTDADEANIYHTDPLKDDTDGDGIPDNGEVYLWGAAYNDDIDGDGIRNIAETDADNDGVSDRQELARGSNMKDPASTPPALTLYDNFSSGSLNVEKWTPEEYQMITKDGTLQLFMRTPAAYSTMANTLPTANQNIKTTFTVNELDRNTDGFVAFNLNGYYYHENADPSLKTGRVYAIMAVGDSGSGLSTTYYIYRIIDETGQMAAVKSGSVTTPILTTGTPYKMEIRYNGTNGFTFNLYNNFNTIIGTATDTGNAFGAPLTDRRGLQVVVENGGKIGVSVDSIEMSNGAADYTEYDGFDSPSSSPLDPSLWSTPETAKTVSADGKLHLLNQSFNGRMQTRAYLKHRFNYIECKVKIDSKSYQTDSTKGRVRLEGYLYNDSHGPNSGSPYNGYEGNIWGRIAIDYTKTGGLVANTYFERVTNSDYTTSEEIFSDQFEIPISFDTEYILYLAFTGDYMISGIDSADGTQHAVSADGITTEKYLPYDPYMAVMTRQEGTGEGMISSYFDDIRVSGDPLEKAGDVNVDGKVDLKDAILGLQTLSGMNTNQSWSAGDINGDGKIGLPEVIETLNQLSND